MATQIAELVTAFTANTSQVDRAFDQVEKQINGFGKGFSGIGDAIGGAFKMAAGVGIAAVGGLTATVAKSVSVAGDLEQQAANISAVFGNMAPPVSEVKDLINNLALDPKLVVGVQEAGANLEMLAKNGLSWDEIANGAARSTVLLANATGADMATASDIATNAMGIFGLQVSDLDNVVATFVNTANSSQFGVEDLGYALANAGPKAAAMGFELEELFAAMTLTSSGFASGQTMGTSWAWMINGLVPNTDKATTAMQELGLITADGANQFFNADGSGKELTEVIKILQGAFGKLTAEQQMAYSRVIFGQEAFGALSGVLGINNEELNKLIPQMTDFSAVEKGAETRTNTYQAAMAALSDTINSVFSMIGDKFLPIFTKMARGFASFVKDNAQPVVAFFGRFADNLGSFVNSAGEMLTRLNTVFSSQLSILGSDNASFGEKLIAIWDMIYGVGLQIWTSLAESLGKLLPQWLEGLGDWAKGLWEWIKESAPKALEALWEWAKDLGGWIVENAPTWASNFWEWAKATWAWIVEVTPVAVAAMLEFGRQLLLALNTFFYGMGPVVSDLWNIVVNIFTAAYALVTGNWTLFWSSLENIVVNFKRTMWPILQEWGANLWKWIVEVTPIVLTKLGEWGRALWDWLSTNAPTWWAKLGEWATLAWQWIVEVTPKVLEQLGIWGAAIWQFLVANGPSWLGPLGEWAAAAWQWIATAIPIVVTKLGEWGTAIWGWLTANGPIWVNTLLGWGNAALGFIQAVGNTVSAIGTIFAPIVTAATSFITWKDVVMGAGIALTVAFIPAILAALAPLGSLVVAFAPVLAIFAVATVAIAALRTAWESDWNGVKTHTTGAIAYIQDRFAPLAETIAAFGVEALAEIAAWATGTETDFSAVNTIVGAARTTFDMLWRDFASEFPKTATYVSEAAKDISDNWKIMSDYVAEKTSGLTQAIADFGAQSLTEIGLWLTGQETDFAATKTIWQEFQNTVTDITNDLVNVILPPMGTWFATTFPNAAAATVVATQQLSESWKIMNQDISDSFATTQRDYTDFMTMLQITLDTGLAYVVTETTMMFANLGLALAALGAAGVGDWDSMWKALNQITENQAAVQYSKQKFQLAALGALMTSGGKEVTNGFRDGVDAGAGGAFAAADRLSSGFSGKFTKQLDIHSPSGVFRSYGNYVVEGFHDGFNSRWSTFASSSNSTVSGWIGWFKRVFDIRSPSGVFEDYGTNIVAGLAKGITGAQDMVYSAMGDLSGGMNASMSANADYAYEGAYVPPSNAGSEDAALMRENNMLLRQLIAALNAKEMSASVTVAGRGSSIADANNFALGLRGV